MNKNCFNRLSILFGLGVASITLSACDSLRSTFGLDHYQPDEFKVSDNPPLSMPKDYKLRPPAGSDNNSEGATVGKETTSSSSIQAQTLLVGSSGTPTSSAKNKGEQSLLAAASGQQQAAPNIRETVNREAAVTTNVSDALLQRIMSWKEEAAKNIASINAETASTAPVTNQSGSK